MIKKTLATLFLLIIAIPSNAIIPEFEALYTKEYYSANGLYMVRIIPEFIPNRYYKWKDSNPYRKKLFTEKDTTIIPCHAQFYQITTTDTLLKWEKNLINKQSPLSAIISNNGATLITFDDWPLTGRGDKVMVIYNENGVCLKHYDLKAITLDTTDYSWPYTNIRWKIFTKFIADERIEIHFNNEKQRIYNTNDLDFEVEAK